MSGTTNEATLQQQGIDNRLLPWLNQSLSTQRRSSMLHSPNAFLYNTEAVAAASLPLCTGQALSAVLSAWKASIEAPRDVLLSW